jgi:hypothetical protein
MTKVPELGFDPEPATIKISFEVYGKKFVYDQTYLYVPRSDQGIDDRVIGFFRNSYFEARLEARSARFMEFEQNRLAEEKAKDLKLIEELKTKHAG